MRILLALSTIALATTPVLAADAAHPTVIELYQSQGCSSCPPADAVLAAIADRPDVLALNFAVTYWDQLGWKDTFAQPAFTQRQWAFARAAGRGNVATPQVIVNGRAALTGNRRADVDAAVARNDRGNGGPAIDVQGGKAVIGAGRGAGTVWLVRYDPRTIQVPIRAGENNGRTIPHRNVVRQMVKLGDWRGASAAFALPAAARGLNSALLLQNGNGGAIIAARRI